MDTKGYLQIMMTSMLMGQTMDISFFYKFAVIAFVQYLINHSDTYYAKIIKYWRPETITVKLAQMVHYSKNNYYKNPAHNAIINYIIENEPHIVDEFINQTDRSFNNVGNYHKTNEYIDYTKPLEQIKNYSIKIYQEKEIIYKGSPIFIKIIDGGEQEKSIIYMRHSNFLFIDTFCTDCLKIINEYKKYPLYENGDGIWNGLQINVHKTIDDTFLNKGIVEKILLDLEDYSMKKSDDKLGFTPNKLGFIFHGPPGNGKSSLCYMIANYTKRSIYRIKASDLTLSKGLSHIISQIPPGSILSIDDADLIFSDCKKRKLKSSIEMKKLNELKCKNNDVVDDIDNESNDYSIEEAIKKMKNATLLHELLTIFDGYTYLRDTIVVLTTNKIEDFDPALLRPGRFERTYLIDDVDEYQIGQIYKHFTGSEMDLTRLKKGLTGLSVSEFLYKHVIPNRKNLDKFLLD